jgi:hypothetical protein
MPTHLLQLGPGMAASSGTGGVSGGGGSGTLAGTTTIEEVRSVDDSGGSTDLGISYSQVGFSNAPSTCSALTDGTVKWHLVGTNKLTLIVSDDSNATGETGTSDITASYRPTAVRPPLLNNFEDADGYEAFQYARAGTKYHAVELLQTGAEPETFQGPMWWNGTQIYTGSMVPGSIWSPNMTYTHTDGYTYKVGSYQEVYNDDTYYSITRGIPEEEHYRYTTTNAVTGIKAVFTPTVSSSAGSGGGGAITPLKTFDGTPIPNNSTLSAMDSGWKTTSGDMSTGVTLAFTQTTGSMNDSSAAYTLDGQLDLYARDSVSGDVLVKSIRVKAQTTAVSTY